MKKAPRIGCIVVASLAGLVVLALVLLPVLLNSRAVARLLDKYAAEYIDGELEHGSIRVSPYRHFPVVGITLEDVALTYPHERFSPYDTLPAPSRHPVPCWMPAAARRKTPWRGSAPWTPP